jgi:hypothetical protein
MFLIAIQNTKECLETIALDLTSLHQSISSFLFLIAFQTQVQENLQDLAGSHRIDSSSATLEKVQIGHSPELWIWLASKSIALPLKRSRLGPIQS